MEMFAGEVNESDKVFMDFATTVDVIIGDAEAPASLRHEVLQLAIIFMCGINQLSPGAYFLRRDLFGSILSIMKDPKTEMYTFEALLLLSLLANFHKSDAAKLNPYLQRIAETTDIALMRNICWAANFATAATIKAYQVISDDSPPTMASAFTPLVASLRLDHALSSTPVDPPRELFKNQPIEACLVLLPVFEFLHSNRTFLDVLLEPMLTDTDNKPAPTSSSPLPYNLITLSSYLTAHATSLSSPRAIAYANLALSILLTFVEKEEIMRLFSQPSLTDIRLCRQRLPVLPLTSPPRPPVCAILDCCVIWLRHNLHRQLEVYMYMWVLDSKYHHSQLIDSRTCVRICHRVLWYLQKESIRLEYHWLELWKAVFGLLDFLVNKLDSLATTGGIQVLAQETILLLDSAFRKADDFLPAPSAVHASMYELVRSAPALRKLKIMLRSLAVPNSSLDESPSNALSRLIAAATYYEEKIASAQSRTASQALRVVAKNIDQDGIHGLDHESHTENPP
ncbi:hypothetical protein HETIRDRAFT_166541 [Heterobasidion irregulare TC 32-1]|uniref:Armadillo-like helical domain-containing protein n=1 Tax=Heterobasidion irregulare (strain TC 32-1) TaxID=747525 RepID=W4KMF1_HETIT|nr:uncharacterized protein HETIRDRAFT_166541 [Heterobasidion irregulare TC 32-1]ETW87018.1 hypothetical protein HETIRDRAFT_166541 [Heterobasidion irregulare TC 32-1]